MPISAPPTRTSFRWLLILAASCSWCWAPQAADASNLRRTATVVAVERAAPSVVNIHGRKTIRDDQAAIGSGATFRQVNGMGTGVIVDERGYIVTNYHVVEGVGRIQVSLADGTTVVGKLIAHDPKNDLAILKIRTAKPMEVITIGTSSDLMRGEPVIAVGNAYGYDHTVTEGIISALKRPVQVSDQQKYKGLIQTDASINPGNSGGPLLNIDGEMIGINVAVRVGAQGIGFAIPVDEAMAMVSRLLNAERLSRIRHGIVGETTIEAGKARFVVASVASDSPAGKAGLRRGDVIREIDGHDVHRSLDVERFLLDHKAGDDVQVAVSRSGDSQEFTLTVAKGGTPRNGLDSLVWETLGLQLSPVSSHAFRQYGSRYRGGLRVTSVRSEGPGSQQGIRPGDVLVGVHKWETVSLDNIAYILGSNELHANSAAKFYILRGAETLYGQFTLDLP